MDLSSPQAAATTFTKAICVGDAAGARAASVGTDDQRQSVEALISFIDGLRVYDQALMHRFGPEAIQVHTQIDQTLQDIAEQPVRDVEKPVVSQSNDRATVQPAYQGMKLGGRAPLILSKTKAGWKVDLGATAQRDPQFRPEMTRAYAQAGRALHDTARQVAAGRFKTLDEAQQGAGQ